MKLWQHFTNIIIDKTLRLKKGASIQVTNSDNTVSNINLAELAALDSIGASDLAKIDGITNGTAAAGKAVVLDSNSAIDIVKFGAIGASDSSLAIDGQAAAQGGDVVTKGGTSSTSGNAGGEAKLQGGTPGATGTGGAATVVAGPGGATSGNGGIASVTGGAATAGNGNGGVGRVVGGAGQGSGNGGVARCTGGAAGATGTGGDAIVTGGNGGATSGAGGQAQVTGGMASGGNSNGGSVILTGGVKAGTGVDGMIIERSIKLVKQSAPTAKTTDATLTAAELQTGIITVNQGAAGTSSLTLPLAADMDTAFPDAASGDAFDFSVINTSSVAAEDATLITNTGWTLVGEMTVESNDADRAGSSGRFRARRTGSGAWTLYRLS